MLQTRKDYPMEITNIESGTFNEMLARMEHAARIIEDVSKRYQCKAMGEWIDNQDACLLLGVSPRTLQAFRDNGNLAYSQIRDILQTRRRAETVAACGSEKTDCKPTGKTKP